MHAAMNGPTRRSLNLKVLVVMTDLGMTKGKNPHSADEDLTLYFPDERWERAFRSLIGMLH